MGPFGNLKFSQSLIYTLTRNPTSINYQGDSDSWRFCWDSNKLHPGSVADTNLAGLEFRVLGF